MLSCVNDGKFTTFFGGQNSDFSMEAGLYNRKKNNCNLLMAQFRLKK